jgi:hypothetical protein
VNVLVNDAIDHELYVAGIRTGFTSYTPTLTQSGTVPKTSTSYYIQIGKFVHGYFSLVVSGTGGVASNIVAVGLPVPISSNFAGAFNMIGNCVLYRSSNLTVYPGAINGIGYLTTVQGAYTNGTQYLGINNFAAALATGDQISGSFSYQAA